MAVITKERFLAEVSSQFLCYYQLMEASAIRGQEMMNKSRHRITYWEEAQTMVINSRVGQGWRQQITEVVGEGRVQRS